MKRTVTAHNGEAFCEASDNGLHVIGSWQNPDGTDSQPASKSSTFHMVRRRQVIDGDGFGKFTRQSNFNLTFIGR
jgi:hypothetical protein